MFVDQPEEKSEAAALMARMAKIAARVLARGCDLVAVALMRSSVFGDGANHQRGQQERQVDDAYFEQIAGHHAALGLAGRAQNAGKANGVGEIEKSQCGGGKCVDGPAMPSRQGARLTGIMITA